MTWNERLRCWLQAGALRRRHQAGRRGENVWRDHDAVRMSQEIVGRDVVRRDDRRVVQCRMRCVCNRSRMRRYRRRAGQRMMRLMEIEPVAQVEIVVVERVRLRRHDQRWLVKMMNVEACTRTAFWWHGKRREDQDKLSAR